jgi:hypothetical protein
VLLIFSPQSWRSGVPGGGWSGRPARGELASADSRARVGALTLTGVCRRLFADGARASCLTEKRGGETDGEGRWRGNKGGGSQREMRRVT